MKTITTICTLALLLTGCSSWHAVRHEGQIIEREQYQVTQCSVLLMGPDGRRYTVIVPCDVLNSAPTGSYLRFYYDGTWSVSGAMGAQADGQVTRDR